MIKLNSGQTLLGAHNIDLAPKIDNLRIGDAVAFFGENKTSPQLIPDLQIDLQEVFDA